jgi:murein DD-endopeptidase MepM/ murein hydrolase activator NlpD
VRIYGATFIGAFLFSLIYTTKPDSNAAVTLARSGDTALVLDTSARDTAPRASLDTSAARVGSAAPVDSLPPLPNGGSSSPPVVPADLELLKSEHLIVPVAGVAAKDLVDSFDEMRDGTRHHNALDIMAARNTPVLAAVSGRVLQLHNSVAGGLSVYQADPSTRFVMMYGHLDSYRPGLALGQTVKQGEIIGFVGSTGNANPLAPHLHFQVVRNDNLNDWWKGTPVNPFPVLRPKG